MDGYHFSLLVLAGLFGVAIGSFLNVVIFRLRSGMKLTGRSRCMACSKTLTPRMLVPLFSYLFQRGRCAYCSVRISPQYFLVEAALGVIFAVIVVVHQFDPLHTTLVEATWVIIDALIWTIFLGITVYDLRHKIIPDSFSFALAISAGVLLLLKWKFGLIPTYYIPFLDYVPSWIDFAAGPFLAIPFALLWFFSGGRAMGLGDAKLALGLGWFLGFSYGVSAVILAFWVAFFPSIALLLLRGKNFTMKSEIPFAPFLVIGAFLTYAFGVDILGWSF